LGEAPSLQAARGLDGEGPNRESVEVGVHHCGDRSLLVEADGHLVARRRGPPVEREIDDGAADRDDPARSSDGIVFVRCRRHAAG
jgi:hypothetical protein